MTKISQSFNQPTDQSPGEIPSRRASTKGSERSLSAAATAETDTDTSRRGAPVDGHVAETRIVCSRASRHGSVQIPMGGEIRCEAAHREQCRRA